MELWGLQNYKTLIIDDYYDMRIMLQDMVFSLGAVDVSMAKNGEEAITLMNSTSYDIILCDYNLGHGKDGQQILEEAKYKKLIRNSSVFMMITAENTAQRVIGAMEYLPDAYLSKPFTKATLRTRLRKLLESKEAYKDILKSIEQEQFDQALHFINKACSYNSRHRYPLLKIKGELYIKLGRYVDAEQFYEDILEERELVWALLGLGQVYYYTDRYSNAVDLFEQIIEQNEYFMVAYDWLAKTLDKLGNQRRTKQILLQATKKSPKAIFRQRHLGNVCLQLNDYPTSETAFQNAIEFGRHSCFKNASDYTKLTTSLLEQGKVDEALKITKQLNQDFPSDKHADLIAEIIESSAHLSAQAIDKAIVNIEKSISLFKSNHEILDHENAITLANNCLKANKPDYAELVFAHVLRNNHDDQTLIKQIQTMFNAVNLENRGNSLIESICNEIVQINNEGVSLAEQGKYQQSIELFIQAANAMPQNILINLNAVRSILLNINENPEEINMLKLAKKYLDQAANIDDQNEKYLSLYKAYDSLAGSQQIN